MILSTRMPRSPSPTYSECCWENFVFSGIYTISNLYQSEDLTSLRIVTESDNYIGWDISRNKTNNLYHCRRIHREVSCFQPNKVLVNTKEDVKVIKKRTMGNNGSRKNSEEINSDFCGQTAEAMKKAEESSGNTPTDPYDKLIAWMVEMAETDDLPVDTLAYANHMSKKVSHQKRRHSATENHQSSAKSAGSFRCSRSTESTECVVDPRTKFRRSRLTRQGTSESSGDFLDTDSGGNGAVFENLCNGSDNEGDATDPTSLLLNRYKETTFIKASPLAVSRHGRYKMPGMSTSVGDLLETRSFGDFLQKRKAMSLNNMKRANSDANQESFISPIKEENVISILDDDLLDGNMADILFSVETLWPKTNK